MTQGGNAPSQARFAGRTYVRRHDTIGTRPTKCSSTIPDVCIIETLKLTDEAADRSEGVLLSAAMRLSAKHPRYAYLRTGQEMSVFLGQFCTSQYRYLHLSCHGNEDVLATTLDVLPFGEVARSSVRSSQSPPVHFSLFSRQR